MVQCLSRVRQKSCSEIASIFTTMDRIVHHTIHYVMETLAGAEGGHDWHHSERVWKLARHIREREGEGDLLTVELAALLHDISDPKFNHGDEERGARLAYDFLMKQGLGRERAEHIRSIVRYISFRGGLPQDHISTIEFRIVQDADRLDAMGAIGIARAFNYGGFSHRPIYDPSVPVQNYRDSGAYYRSGAPTINHFYEKLLKLKDMMNTPTGRSLALERHEYMEQFLERFFRECDPGSKTGNSG
jgi:uncharacterized protein